MHKSMEILMARMDSHPEEFDITFRSMNLNYLKRWDFILKPLMDRCEAIASGEPSFLLGFLSDEEVGEVFAKLMQVQGDACTQRIMNELLNEEEDHRVRFGDGWKYTGTISYSGDPVMTVPTESGGQQGSGCAWIY